MPAYQPSELPPDDANFGLRPDDITAELLTLSWEFFTHASPATREELRRFLTARGHHPTAGLGAFLDGLQFTADFHQHRPEPPTT